MFFSLLMSENSVTESAHITVPTIAKNSASLRITYLCIRSKRGDAQTGVSTRG